MINIRQIILENRLGNRVEFNEFQEFFGVNPSGMGIQNSNSFLRLNGTYVLVSQTQNVINVKIDLIITRFRAYDGFRQLTDFIARNGTDTFKFIVIPAYSEEQDRREYFIDCYIQEIGKTEIKDNYFMVVPITLNKVSDWQLDEDVTIIIDSDITDSKTYPYEYPYIYASGSSGNVSINNNAHKPAPLNITIAGPSTNPELILTQDGTSQSVKLTVAIGLNESIRITSEPGEQEITKINTLGEEENIYKFQDFTLETFLFANIGTSILTYSNDIGNPGLINIVVKKLFLAV